MIAFLTRIVIALGRHGHSVDEVRADIDAAADAARVTAGDRAAARRALAIAVHSSADAWRYRLSGRVRDLSGRTIRESLMTSILFDISAGVRLLRRSPGFAAAAILMIAFGVGSMTAIFSIANAQMITPLPYKDGRNVVFVRGWDIEANRLMFNMPVADYLDLRDANLVENASAYRYWSTALTGRGVPERLQGYFTTGNTFEMLGVPAALGRALQRSDDGAQPGRVVLLSHQAWIAHFGGDASIVGQRIQLDGQSYEVVGVMPKSFEFPVLNFKGDLWVPFGMNEAAIRAAARGDSSWATVVGRLRQGQSVDQAQAAVTSLMDRLRRDHPVANRTLGASVIGMQEMGLEELRPALVALMIAVSMVLLLACANLANLMLARGVARRRELAVRAALGAGRGRLVRQLLTETLVFTTAGGLLGALGAWWLMEVLRTSLPPFVRSVLPNVDVLRVDTRALMVAFACSTMAGVLSGILPAMRASRDAAGDALRVRDGAPAASRRATGMLVAVQVALSVVLLCGAVLLVRSFGNIERVDPGFNGRGVLTMTVTLPASRYADAAAQRQFFEQSLERIAALPGVESAAAVNVLPFSTYNRGGSVRIPGRRDPARTSVRVTTPGYPATIGVPLIRGRALSAQDRQGAQRVALVNREFERRYLNGQAVLGSTIRFGETPDGDHVIVGVIGNVLHNSLLEPPDPEVHTPFAQQPSGFMMLAIRAAQPLQQASVVRRVIAGADPLQPVFEVDTLDALVARAAGMYRQISTVMTVFALAAAALALVGLYALVAYSAKQRTREVGVRLALGATRGDVVRTMMRSAIGLTAAGTCVGLGVALIAMAGLESMLFGITPRDPATLTAVPLALVACAALAAYVPARRAARVDPAMTLRD